MSDGNTAIPVSPVNDMVAALNAALASHARVPELEASNKQLADKLDSAQYHNQRLEENILGYKNQISDLISKVRSLEVERDDAGFRALETEDKLATLLKAVRNAAHDLDAEAMHVDPPKPEPKPEPVAEVKGQSEDGPTVEGNPTQAAKTGSPVTYSPPASPDSQPFASHSADTNPSEGSQSKPDPFASDKSSEIGNAAKSTGAESTANVSQNTTIASDPWWNTR